MTTLTAPARLDVTEKQATAYCIPLWLRDRQIREATQRVPGRLAPQAEARPDPIAVVGFGPSLSDTWEQVRGFRYVMSCSGSHRFLVERGIVPTWHCAVDPRPHKVALIGPPQAATEYLIASTCHRAVFDHLEGFAVKLWHVFDATTDGLRVLPPGEWLITGGCDVGLRALTLAGCLGFRDLHVFGLDGCARDEMKHAAAHPNAVTKWRECEYEGVVYQTTPGMLEAARQLWHELDQMPAVTAMFYGEGLVQAMAKRYVPKPGVNGAAFLNAVAFAKPALISAEYRDLNARLHAENPYYGSGGARHAPTVLKLLGDPRLRSVLDYGAGKRTLARELAGAGVPIWEYDPAVPEIAESPRPADLVVATDVLEHVEPEHLRAVLGDLQRCVLQVGYFTIHTGPAQKTLADGRNTHLTQKDAHWWRQKLQAYFGVAKLWVIGPEVHALVGPKTTEKPARARVSVVSALPPEADECGAVGAIV